MKINLPVFKDEDKKMPSLSKLALGFNSVFPCWVQKLHPPVLCYLLPTGLSRGVGKKLRDRHHFSWHTCCTG